MACQSLSSISTRAFSSARDTFLVSWYVKRVFIKCGRLCAPHVQRCDDNLTVEISLPLWAGKPAQLLLMGSINDFLELICLFTFVLKSSGAYTLGSVKLPSKLKSLSSTKSPFEEIFLLSVSFLPSLTHDFSFLSLLFSRSLLLPSFPESI